MVYSKLGAKVYSVLVRTTPVPGLPPINRALVVDHQFRTLSREGVQLDQGLTLLGEQHGYSYSGASLGGIVIVTVPTEDNIRPTAEDIRSMIDQLS